MSFAYRFKVFIFLFFWRNPYPYFTHAKLNSLYAISCYAIISQNQLIV
jgi:hypothetical protein